jgi:hypothetical protein
MRPKDKELTPEFLEILVWAVEDLTPAQHQQGIKNLIRHAKYFPNGAELRAACLGIPVGAEAAKADPAMAAKIEANRLWTWLGKWAQTLLDGHHYTMTTIPSSGNPPKTYSYTGRSLRFDPFPQDNLKKAKKGLAGAKLTLETYKSLHPGPNRYFDPVVVEATRKRYETDVEAATVKVAEANALLLLDEKDRRYCRLRVEMAPPMPGYLEEVLTLLAHPGCGPGEVIQRFLQGDDKYLNHNFREKTLEVIAAHAVELGNAAPARQLTGAVISNDERRTYHGIIHVDAEGGVTYYSPEVLRHVADVVIDESDIEKQAVFVAVIKEITNASYNPPPPPKPATPEPSDSVLTFIPMSVEIELLEAGEPASIVTEEYYRQYREGQRLSQQEVSRSFLELDASSPEKAR